MSSIDNKYFMNGMVGLKRVASLLFYACAAERKRPRKMPCITRFFPRNMPLHMEHGNIPQKILAFQFDLIKHLSMFFVYVLYSQKDSGLYIGFTTDLNRRINEHQEGLCVSTVRRRPLILAYYEAYYTQNDAKGRERFLKSGSGRVYLKKQLKFFITEHPLRTTA